MRKIILVILTILISTMITGCSRISGNNVKRSFNNSNSTIDKAEITVPAQVSEVSKTNEGEKAPEPSLPPVKDDLQPDPGLYPAYKETHGVKQYGYINSNGDFILTPIFDSASNYSDGLAVVSINGIYEVIDKNGYVIFKNNNIIENFNHGAAIIHKVNGNEELMGYIDTKGNIIIEPQYQSAGDFNSDNKAIVSKGNGTYLVIDKTGKTLESHPTDEIFDVREYKDGYRVYTDYNTWKTGVVDMQSKAVFEPIFSQIYNIGNGLFAIRKQSNNDNSAPIINPMAVFDKDGNQLTDYIHYEVNEFYGLYASASDNKYTYFIGRDGKQIENLPKVEGIGSLKMLGEIIQADIDDELFYMKKDGTILWKPDDVITLADGITVKELKSRPNRFTLIHYPCIGGLKNEEVQTTINKQLEKLFERNKDYIRVENAIIIDDYFTAKLNKDLLVINKKGYDNPYGAAHGMPVNDYYYFNIKTGKCYELNDLFKEDSYYISILNMNINKQIEEMDSDNDSIPIDNFEGITKQQGFILSDNALTVYFYPYDIAAYAAGFPKFKISYAKIIDIIDKEGEFWNSFNHENTTPIYKPDDTDLSDMMDCVIKLYDKAMVNAVNTNDFSYVEPHLVEGTSLYKAKKDQVENYYKNQIVLKYLDSTIENIEYDKDHNMYLVHVSQSVSLKQAEVGNEIRKQSCIFTVSGSKEKHKFLINDISDIKIIDGAK